MWPITVTCGVALIVLGVAAKLLTGTTSYTPLIPSGFGVVLVLLGLLAAKDAFRKHAMHLAAVVGLLGVLGAAWRAGPYVPVLLSGGTPVRTNPDGTQSDATGAVVSTLVMGLICLLFVGLCVNSFIQARRARRSQPAEEARA